MMDAEVVIVPDAEALAHEAARRFGALAREAAAARGRFSVALSGGSTPVRLYRLLAEEPHRRQIPWGQVHLFWGDERSVPPDEAGSNYRSVKEHLIDHVPIPSGNIHRAPGELEPAAGARSYEKALQEYFCGPRSRFDLVLLGLGNDGHTASLFPHSAALRETEHMVVSLEANYRGRPVQRLTLTLPVINAARYILVLVTGSAKAEIVQAVLEGPPGPFPAQQLKPQTGQLTWLLDAEAASRLGA